jgi:hypothetical protein
MLDPETTPSKQRAIELIEYLETFTKSLLERGHFNADQEKMALESRLNNFREAFDDTLKFIDMICGEKSNSLEFAYSIIINLMWSAILLGSGTGVSDEAREYHLSPIKSGASRGGKKSVETRTTKRGVWEPHAKELALAEREKHPASSQDTVVNEIIYGWKHEEVEAPPSHSTLKRLISRWEKSGELPRRRV